MNAAIATPLQILHTPEEAADWLRAHAADVGLRPTINLADIP